MPRIRQNMTQYLDEDFKKELFRCLAERYENVSVRALSRETGICQSTLNVKIRRNVSDLDIGELRRIVPLLKPDPAVILKLVGYTGEDIRKLKNS